MVEVLLAMTVLSIGVLGLIGTGVAVQRLLARGHWATVAATRAERRVELLRASATTPSGCAGLTGGSAALPGQLNERWTVSGSPSTATIQVVVDGGARPDTITTVIPCR